MLFLGELWFLASASKLEFKSWKTRKKKSSKIIFNLLSSIWSILRVIFILTSLILMFVLVFSTFPSSSNKIITSTESELEANISELYPTAGAKTLRRNGFQNYGQVQQSILLSNMVSTETEFSSVFRTQKKFLNTSPCSAQFFQQFTKSLIFLKISSSRALILLKTSDLNQ